MKNFISLSILFLSFLCLNNVLFAQNGIKDTISTPKELKSVTHHKVIIGGKTIQYTATAGALILRNSQDEPIAFYGYTAYTKDEESELDKRPITFAYNGGPGSSSMWLHMGALGPKRVVVNDPYNNKPAPYKVEDNQFSILDKSDVVLIDPVGTGISKAVGKANNKDFWGVDEDIKSVSGFIKQYINENNRWPSPKFILGESYGTMRSAGVANYLQEELGIALNGIILVSTVLDIRTLTFQQGDDLSYILHLPAYAVSAWYHDKIVDKTKDIALFAEKARSFASGEYASALMKGSDLTDEEFDKIATQYAALTGLSKEYVRRANLRVKEPQFSQELLRTERMTVGRLDARYKGINENLLSEGTSYDPQSSSISPPYISAFLDYYYNELKVNKMLTYKTSAYSTPGFTWDWKHKKNHVNWDPITPNTAVDLAEVMRRNPSLRVLAINGYYDLATPFYAAEYTLKHMGLEKHIQSNIIFKYYESGHMMYIDPVSGKQFKDDIIEFINLALK